jgi:flagellar assembly factor FliW
MTGVRMLRVVGEREPAIEPWIHSPVLGRVDVDPARVVRFLEPIAGFPGCASYALLPYEQSGREDPEMRWLQALEAPFHTFLVTDPWSVEPDYEPEIADSDAAQLETLSFAEASLFGVLTISREHHELTINLQAPLVVNTRLRLGKQVVLLNREYTTRHRVCALP